MPTSTPRNSLSSTPPKAITIGEVMGRTRMAGALSQKLAVTLKRRFATDGSTKPHTSFRAVRLTAADNK